MKWMVEFHFKSEHKDQVMELFEQQGPNRNPGVKFRGAWIGSRTDVAFVLVEGDDEKRMEDVAQSWSEHGSYKLHPCVEVENY